MRIVNSQSIEDDKFHVTAAEITRRFGGCTLFLFREGGPTGYWWDRGVIYRDVHALIEVDVPDATESWEWIRMYVKEVLLERFQQRAIYCKLIGPVESLVISKEEIR